VRACEYSQGFVFVSVYVCVCVCMCACLCACVRASLYVPDGPFFTLIRVKYGVTFAAVCHITTSAVRIVQTVIAP
jgi:hypothetical protein